MNSFQTSSRCESNAENINISHCSGDLFQESPQLECEIHNSFTYNIKFSSEKSSETSEELPLIPRRKPRRALSFSDNNSHCFSNKSCDSIKNASNNDSSKFFQPISPVCNVDEIDSSSLLEINQPGSPEKFMTPRIHHLSKENVAVISVVSDSEHSSSSSILEDSFKSGNEYQSSKQFFKTPLCSSVKKRTIRQWLSNVSLNCSIKPNTNDSFDHHVVVPSELNNLEDHDDSKLITLNVVITPAVEKNNDRDKRSTLNNSETVNLNDDRINENNTTANYCPSLFDSFNIGMNECSIKQYEVLQTSKGFKFSNQEIGQNISHSYQKSPKPKKSLIDENSCQLTEPLGKSLHNYKSKDYNSLSEGDDDSAYNEIRDSNHSKIVESDDSFVKIRLRKNKKKRNCLNISSDDSEAKDTANESEDIPHLNSEPFTPRKKLYFRNPLNNSLDDDANPLSYCEDYVINPKNKSHFNEKKIDKSSGLLDQICSEVHDMSVKSPPGYSPQNIDTSNDHCNDNGPDVESGPVQDGVNQSNFSCSSSDKDFNPNKSANESWCESVAEELNSPKNLSIKLDDSIRAVVDKKSKVKKNNAMNFSDNDSFLSKNPNANIIDVNEVFDNEPNPSKKTNSIDLTKSDDEYDKFMYRTRSDSSFSDYEDIPGVTKDSSEVISVHTTTSSEEGGDEENSPWFDLESYLKKNIPASSKSLDSPLAKNSEKRRAELAKISLPTHSCCPDHTSFLLSLTPEVPDEMCHPEAFKYRGESFSKNKKHLVDLLFKLYNKEIFDEKLPPLEIKWSGHLTTTSGITKSTSKITKKGKIRNSIIKLSKTVVNDASKVRDVLLHELCHAANWLIDEEAGGHGPLFKKWVNKIWIKFPEVPRVKTTHHYELNWKYLYKCSYCGYELGKMKLSLNETSCRLCGGLVTVNT